ncbi:MAG: sigma-70 family RNA polymerase sigma factor [Candidatus Thiodiazotropha sp.]
MSGVREKNAGKNQKRDQRLRDLLAASALNDRKAFAEVYRIAAPILYGIVLHILKREAWAEECLQEAFVKIWNNADSYRSHLAAPMTWMATIARNQALDQLRRYRRETLEADGSYISEEIDTDPLPLEKLTHSEEGARLKICLERLNEKQRLVIGLAYFRGLTQNELANQIDMPLGTVKTQIRRSLEQLRGCLQ